jgi:hypothetical protein
MCGGARVPAESAQAFLPHSTHAKIFSGAFAGTHAIFGIAGIVALFKESL